MDRIPYVTPDVSLSSREPNDFYPTPHHCTTLLLRFERFGPEIEEPACGDGAISRVLAHAGHSVFSSDLIDRGYGRGGVDFLRRTKLRAPHIVTNPPFKIMEEFVLHAHRLGATKIAMFGRLSFLEAAGRYDRLWSVYPPVRVWIFSKRQTLWRGDDPNARKTGGTQATCWFVWERTETYSPPVLGWLR